MNTKINYRAGEAATGIADLVVSAMLAQGIEVSAAIADVRSQMYDPRYESYV